LKPVAYIEHLDVLHYLSGLLKIESYLEVGVREGASLLCVLCEEPEIVSFTLHTIAEGVTRLTDSVIQRVAEAFTVRSHIRNLYLLDLWKYREQSDGWHINRLLERGFPNSGLKGITYPNKAKKTLGFQERGLKYITYPGDSKKTLPALFKENPKLIIDLVLVDGDHSDEGVKADLDNLAGHFKVLVVHDVFNPEYPTMINVIKEFVKKHNLLTVYCGKYLKTGTAIMFNMDVNK